MPTFVGFNTQNQFKKFTLVDFELVKRDLSNALNIKQGALPGRPSYGTTIWSYLFENQSTDTTQGILQELQRVVSTDPRIYITEAAIYPQDNGILIELQVQIAPGTSAQQLQLYFDQQSQVATVV